MSRYDIEWTSQRNGANPVFPFREVLAESQYWEKADFCRVNTALPYFLLTGNATGSMELVSGAPTWPLSAHQVGIPQLVREIDALLVQMESGTPRSQDPEQRKVAQQTAGSKLNITATSVAEWAASVAQDVSQATD